MPQQYAILDYIGQVGRAGALQSDLPKIFGFDAKKAHFNLRKLELGNLVHVLAFLVAEIRFTPNRAVLPIDS